METATAPSKLQPNEPATTVTDGEDRIYYTPSHLEHPKYFWRSLL